MDALQIPEDLSGLSDAELDALREEATERAAELDNDETLAELDATEAASLMENAITALEAIDAESAVRAEKAEADAKLLAETRERMQKRLNPEPETEDEEPVAEEDTEDEPVAEDEVEVVEEEKVPVTASAKPKPKLPRREKQHTPAQATRESRIQALSSIPGIEAGARITPEKAYELIADKASRMQGTDGPREDVPLLRFNILPDNAPTLSQDDPWQNMAIIDKVVGQKALTASGGLCPPAEPFYDLQQISTEATPVLDSLPTFNARRGGIRFMTPPKLSAVTTGVGVMTAANDAIGGTTATKTCQTIPCPEQVVVNIAAIYHCLGFGNMGARAFPELIETFTGLTMAAHARVRETAALDAFSAASIAVTTAMVGGAVQTLIGQLITAAAGLRSRNRMDRNAQVHVWLPAWVQDAWHVDTIRSQFGRFDTTDATFDAQLRQENIAPTYYLDGGTGASQVIGTQSTGALLGFPTTAVWYMAPEGSFLHVSSGELDLGIVRDSVLNATNDFQMFGEVFENVAFVGVESLKGTSQFCANGEVTLPKVKECPVI